MLTIMLEKPIQSVLCQDAKALDMHETSPLVDPGALAHIENMQEELSQQQTRLVQTSQQLEHMLQKVCQYYEDLRSTHQKEIAHLAVEIARKILVRQIREGDYEIEAIITEALSHTSASQDMVIHVHPDDLAECQQLQQANKDSAFAHVTFMGDVTLGKAECLIETPKGIIKSLIEEHLARVQEALNKTH